MLNETAPAPAVRPAIADGAAELSVVRVGETDATQLDPLVLDGAERRRLAKLPPAQRQGYLVAHALLRQLLGERLGVAPEDVRYNREPCPACGGPHGRPALAEPATPPLHFSLSRSDDVVVIAIASAPVGVDVEAHAPSATIAEVTEMLHPAERAEILAVPAATRAATFARIWTRKEAYLKALGTGVASDLDTDYLGTTGGAASPAGWTVTDVAVPADYEAAVALRSERSGLPGGR